MGNLQIAIVVVAVAVAVLATWLLAEAHGHRRGVREQKLTDLMAHRPGYGKGRARMSAHVPPATCRAITTSVMHLPVVRGVGSQL